MKTQKMICHQQDDDNWQFDDNDIKTIEHRDILTFKQEIFRMSENAHFIQK